MSFGATRRGVSTGDLLLGVAAVCLALAVAYPRMRRSRVLARADEIAAGVDSLRAAAMRYHERAGRWPHGAPPGELPQELVVSGALRPAMEGPGYRLQWDVWQRLVEPRAREEPPDSAAAPTPARPDSLARPAHRIDSLPAVTAHVGDPRILRLLLERFGADRSFVRDSSWTLILRPGDDGG